MLREVDPDSKIVEYYENSTVANVNRPPATWGSYLIKKIGKEIHNWILL